MYWDIIGWISVDVNGDGRTDVVCSADDGGIIVWESKDLVSGNFYDVDDPWKDELFGFCPNTPRQVKTEPF